MPAQENRSRCVVKPPALAANSARSSAAASTTRIGAQFEMMSGNGATRLLAVSEVPDPFVRGRLRCTPLTVAVVEQEPQRHAAGVYGGGRITVREFLFEGVELSGAGLHRRP
jgi:hypothetical protein